MNEKIKSIADNFKFDGTLVNIKENTQGNINSTYLLEFSGNKKYLIQKINTYVFKDPYSVMRNIELVTNHIKEKLEVNGDNKHQTLSIVKTNNGENLCVYVNSDGEKEYYRAYEFIDNCISYNNFDECRTSQEEVAYNTGKCFGHFHKLLSDFPANLLVDTIPNFHNTPSRFKDLLVSIENNVANRALNHSDEIVNLITRIKKHSIIWESLGKSIPIRVTHNDTKLNNVLMDKNTNEGVAVIDLDTVMPGTVLFDLGDGIRSACSNSFEDETDVNKIFINLELTKCYLNGYMDEMAPFLKKEEVEYIGLSIMTLTYELVLRFLTDYINGDVYFKVKYLNHNEDRFMNQYHLLLDIEKKVNEIQEYVNKLYNDKKIYTYK